MKFFQPGQKVNVDVFGLGRPGSALASVGLIGGTVVELAPGTVIVRLDSSSGGPLEIAVGPRRVSRAG
jgi:hypothetical protein